MKISMDFESGDITLSMYRNDTNVVVNLSPMSAKLIGETLIANANKMMEYKRREEEDDGR